MYKSINDFFLPIVLSLVSLGIAFSPYGEHWNLNVLLLYFISSQVSLFGLFCDSYGSGISLNKIFFIFHFFFFGIAPIVQFKFGTAFFGISAIGRDVFLQMGWLIFAIQLLYLYLYIILKKRFIYKVFALPSSVRIWPFKFYIIISLLAGITFLYLIKFNWEVIYTRPYYQWQKNNTNLGLIGYSVLLVVRMIPGIVLIHFKIFRKAKFSFIDIYLIICLLFVAFPTSIPRSLTGILYIPVIVLYFPALFKGKNFIYLMFGSILFIFPLMNFFRDPTANEINLAFELFNSPHMDAFQNWANLYDQKLITNGRQFIGSIFFFIQESQWQNRPVGTGQMLAELNDYNYTNISMPLWGEGYANFGYIGIVIFVIIIAAVNAVLDSSFQKSKNRITHVIFLLFLGFEFYLLRGDLYSSIKILYSIILALSFVLCSLKIFSKFFKDV